MSAKAWAAVAGGIAIVLSLWGFAPHPIRSTLSGAAGDVTSLPGGQFVRRQTGCVGLRPTPLPCDGAALAPARAPAPAPARALAPAPARALAPAPARALAPAPARAPGFYAPALGLEVGPATRVDVSLAGELTLFEVDLAEGAIPLRRAWSEESAPGLFGRGWRSEVESRVVPVGHGALLLRVQGATPFVPLEGDLLVSLTGEVELLRRSADGWELAGADGRALRFDPAGRLLAIEPGFAVERRAGRLELLAPGGERVVLHLGPEGRVRRVEAPGGALELRYDAAGTLLEVAGVRRYEHDAQGRLLAVHGSGGELRVERQAAGGLAALTRGDGWSQRYGFEPGRARVDSPQGRFLYQEAEDGLLLIDGPRGRDVAWVDARGRLLAAQRAGEPTRLVARDDLQQPVLALRVDPAEQAERAARLHGLTVVKDGAGRPVEVTTPGGRRWSFSWHERRIVGSDGPAGPVSFQRDAHGRLIARRDASGRELCYERDEHGRPLSVSSAAGDEVRWTRDAEGRPQELLASEGGEDEPQRLQFHWDAEGRPVGSTSAPGGATLVHTAGADEQGAWEGLDSPWGPFFTALDARGLPALLVSPAGVFRFHHDPAGRRVLTEHPQGLSVERERDAGGRLVRQVARQGDRPLADLSWERDARGRGTRRVRDGVETRFAHDAQDRLVAMRGTGGEVAWGWDADGNRVAEGSARVSFDARGRLLERVSPAGRERFVHDEAGRLLERTRLDREGAVLGRDRFEWDGFGRLVAAARAGRPEVRWGYDPLGRLAWREVAGARTRYVHDGERLLAELGPGTRERLWVWGPELDEPLAWGERAAPDAPWRWTHLVLDELHGSLEHVDAQGRPVGTDELDPWGAGPVAPDRPVLFGGRPVDPVAGLVFQRARWYDPDLGRFLSPDPAGLAAGPNAYAWVSGRPLDLVDPLGLEGEAPGWLPWLAGKAAGGAAWVADAAAATKDTVVGATEGLGYLTGLHGASADQAAARRASWEDLAQGRAQSRALGALDAYVSGLSLGLVDPNTSGWAWDPAQARAGRAWGQGGATALSLVTLAQAAPGLASGGARAAALGWTGLRAAPGALAATPGAAAAAARALPGLVRVAPGALAAGARALPGLGRDGLLAAWGQRADLARAVSAFLVEQLGNAARVTARPLWNVLVRPWGAPAWRSAGGLLTRLRAAPAAAPGLARATRPAGATARAGDDAASATLGAGDQAGELAGGGPPQDGIVQLLGGGRPAPAPGPLPGRGAPQAPRAPPAAGPPTPSPGAAGRVPQGLTQTQWEDIARIVREELGDAADHVVLQGSRVRGTAQAGSDLDFALMRSPEEFLGDLYREFAPRGRFPTTVPNPETGRLVGELRKLLVAAEKGRLHAGEAGLSEVARRVDDYLRGQGLAWRKTDFSSVMRGSTFVDLGETIPLPRTGGGR